MTMQDSSESLVYSAYFLIGLLRLSQPASENAQSKIHSSSYLPDLSLVCFRLAFSFSGSYTKNSCNALPPGTIGNTGIF